MKSKPEDEPIDDPEKTDADCYCEILDLEMQKRLWLRAALAVIQSRKSEPDQSGRVQLALDLMAIAASEKIRRLLADLPMETD